MLVLPSFSRSSPEVQEEKKDDTSFQGSVEEHDGDETSIKDDEQLRQSPTQVVDTDALSEEQNAESDADTALASGGVNLLDELENEYRMGLSQRVNFRHLAKEEEKETPKDQEMEEPPTHGKTDEAPASPRSPHQQARWYQRRVLSGETLTHEQALEMTVDKLRRQLEDMEEERESLLSTVHNLQGKVEAQQAKIEALEHFFRRVNHREEDENSLSRNRGAWEETSTTSLSSTDPPSESEVATEEANSERQEKQTYEDDEAWELEDGPPKLSSSFQRTGEKMRCAKTRAAAKLAKITFV